MAGRLYHLAQALEAEHIGGHRLQRRHLGSCVGLGAADNVGVLGDLLQLDGGALADRVEAQLGSDSGREGVELGGDERHVGLTGGLVDPAQLVDQAELLAELGLHKKEQG